LFQPRIYAPVFLGTNLPATNGVFLTGYDGNFITTSYNFFDDGQTAGFLIDVNNSGPGNDFFEDDSWNGQGAPISFTTTAAVDFVGVLNSTIGSLNYTSADYVSWLNPTGGSHGYAIGIAGCGCGTIHYSGTFAPDTKVFLQPTLAGYAGFANYNIVFSRAIIPSLNIETTSTNIVVSYPANAINWVLQSSTSLSGDTADWITVSPSPVINGTNFVSIYQKGFGNRYFRLLLFPTTVLIN
jgi:hypothetical protein